MLPLSHPKRAFLVSGNLESVSHLAAPGNLCLSLPVSPGGFAAGLSQVSSHCWTRLLGPRPGHFVLSVERRDHWGKRDSFLSASDSSVCPFYGRWAKSGFSYIPGGSLMLDPWLHSQKLGNVDPPKGLAPVQTGDPQKWPLSGTPGFARGREKTQNFLAFCCLPVSCPLCLSPSIS